jgi:hypothetical protein
MSMTDKMRKRFLQPQGDSGEVSTGSLILLAVLAALGVFVFFRFVEPRLDAKSFKPALTEFGARNMELPPSPEAVAKGGIPHRIGKVLVVVPEHTVWMKPEGEVIPPEIHPTWYRLGRSIRASEPEEVDTLIRISKELRGARLYREVDGVESKVVSAHRVHLDVYDWYGKAYIGRWTFDPGDFKGETMTRDDLDAMIKATSNSTVKKFIKSMPER